MAAELEGRLVLVTGASRGIGRAVAVEAARRGADLVLVARTRGALEEVDDEIRGLGRHATLVALDLRDGAKVDALGAALFERFGKLDGLVHAAGVLGDLAPIAQVDPTRLAETMTVNALTAQRLLRTLFPLLRAAPAARCVFLTDGQGRGRQAAYWGHYAASKAALEAIVHAFAAETRITPIRAVLHDPGPVATALRKSAWPGEDTSRLPGPSDAAPAIVALLCGEIADSVPAV